MMQVYQEMQDAMVKNNPFMAMMPMADEMQKNTQTMLEAFKLPEFGAFEVPGFEELPKLAGIDMFEGNFEAMGKFFPATPVSNFGNLAAHPMAASAASSAVGAGIASATVGTWFGWMTALMDGAVKAQKATKGSSVFAPMAVEGANPMKFDWGFGSGKTAPAFNFATFEWFSTGTDTAPAPVKKKAAPAAKPKAKPATKAVAAPAAKPAPAAKVVAEPVAKPKPAPKPAQAKPAPKPVEVAPAPKPVEAAPAPKAEPVKAVPAAEPVPAALGEPVAATPKPVETVPVEAQVMPEDFAKPKALDKPDAVDDLKMIAGVGPKLEKVLNGLGVWKFEQIAKWTRNEIAWVDDYLQFKGRIDRDDWLAQADALAAGGRDEYVKRFGKEPR